MKTLPLALGLAALALATACLSSCNADADFQKDADTVRLRHLQHYGELIEDYRAKTGRVPLQGRSELPLYVHVATPEQEKNTGGGPPTPHETLPFDALVAELEKGLGRKIDRRYDPQRAPLHRPNFYLYLVRGEDYYFAVHLHQPFPFGKTVAKNYHKVEISNAGGGNLTSTPQRLFTHPPFLEAVSSPLSKQGFFDAREAEDAARAAQR